MVDRLHHVTIPVSDLHRAVRFYGEVLDLTFVTSEDETPPETDEYRWLKADGAYLRLALDPERAGRPGGIRLSFAAPEVSRTDIAARLDDEGIEVDRTGTGSYFVDPDGNRLAIVEPGIPE